MVINTKLTLTLEKKVIEEVKKYAKQKGQRLSQLVENYFKLLTKDSGKEILELSHQGEATKRYYKSGEEFRL